MADPKPGSPMWPDPRAGITNPSGNLPLPAQPTGIRHWIIEGDSPQWINTGTVYQLLWRTPLFDLRSEWVPNDSFLIQSVPSPAVGTFGNGRSLSLQLTGRLATIPWIAGYYVYDGSVSTSMPTSLGRLSQRVPITDQIISGGLNAGSNGIPEGMSLVTLTPPASLRFWQVTMILELPLTAVLPLPSVRVSGALN
jgi:hypothetical protein